MKLRLKQGVLLPENNRDDGRRHRRHVPRNFVAGHAKALTTASTSLSRLDGLLIHQEPSICLSRNCGGIGDVLMTTPLVRAVKERYPSCRLVYATDFGYLNGALPKVLEHNPYIDEIVEWNLATPEQYDAYIDLSCPCIPYEKPGVEPINRIDLFAMHAQVELSDKHMVYVITEEEKAWGKKWLETRNITTMNKLVMINPCASNHRRSWDIMRWQQTAAYLGQGNNSIWSIVVTHDSDYKKTKWDLKNTVEIHNYDVRHVAAILWYCDLLICPDSALLNLGQAIDKKILALFGPTDHRARCNYSPDTTVITHGPEFAEWPCWYVTDCTCKLRCMDAIEPTEVVSKAVELLKLDGNIPDAYTYSRPTIHNRKKILTEKV